MPFSCPFSMGITIEVILYTVIVAVCLTSVVSGHGRLRGPPSRSTMWRYGFSAPPNYNDHELNCGGFSTHWGKNKGHCGICGDNYLDPQPRANEGGGKYGHGVIVREYSQGEIIETEVEVTANHKGYFEFSVCPHNSPTTPAPEDCFRVLELADGSGTRWQLHDDVSPKTYKIAVRLPPDMTCSQCVFRWFWRSGNNWGMENGRGGLGLGPQETFIACSDIAIHEGEAREVSGAGSAIGPPNRRPLIGRPRTVATTTTTPRTTTTVQTTQRWRPRPRISWSNGDEDDDSDEDETESEREPEVFGDDASPDVEHRPSCRARGLWKHVYGMHQWCIRNCAMNFCPISHCCCGC